MKIYIHHYYTEHLFYLLAHNTTNRVFDLKNNEGIVKCKYKDTEFQFIFKLNLSDEDDGYHFIDYTTARSQSNVDEKFYLIGENTRKLIDDTINNGVNNTLYNLTNIVKNKPNWIFSFFNGEKSFYKYENIEYYKGIELLYDVEKSLSKLNNSRVITEEYFIKDEANSKYQNIFYTFSNSIWYWNNHAEIRWYYEFKNIFDKLNFEYDLCYSMRAYKYHRILLLNELKKIDSKKLFIQRSDARKESEEFIKYEKKVSDIFLNSVEGNLDFDNLKIINKQRVGLDLFFRMLPKAKMHLLDESWSFSKNEFSSQYLSEKTLGFILSGIPFISTNDYPLIMIQEILEVPNHPFFNESKKFRANSKLFANFVNDFMKNFEKNYKLCKEWSDIVFQKFINKIETENSLLDLILSGKLERISNKKNMM